MIENVLINTIATARKLLVGRILTLFPLFPKLVREFDELNLKSGEGKTPDRGRNRFSSSRVSAPLV
jgi:hypothetical protein